MSDKIFYKAIGDAADFIKKINFTHYGEALLHPKFFEYASYACSKGFKTRFITNGVLLGTYIKEIFSSGISHVKVSIDSVDPEVYRRYRRGASLNVVLENLKKLYEARNRLKSNLRIQVQSMSPSIEYEPNISLEEKMEDFKRILKGKCDMITSGPLHVYEFKRGVVMRIKRCGMVGSTLIVMHDGRITTCCQDEKGQMVIGSILEDTLRNIWIGKRARRQKIKFKIGKHILSSFAPSLCRRCYAYPPLKKVHYRYRQNRFTDESSG